jgi:hypothetical protein
MPPPRPPIPTPEEIEEFKKEVDSMIAEKDQPHVPRPFYVIAVVVLW